MVVTPWKDALHSSPSIKEIYLHCLQDNKVDDTTLYYRILLISYGYNLCNIGELSCYGVVNKKITDSISGIDKKLFEINRRSSRPTLSQEGKEVIQHLELPRLLEKINRRKNKDLIIFSILLFLFNRIRGNESKILPTLTALGWEKENIKNVLLILSDIKKLNNIRKKHISK